MFPGAMFSSNLAFISILIGAFLCQCIGLNQEIIARPMGRKGRCHYYNSYKAYDCAGLDLQTIPTDLSSSTEVLDVSYNRIRELTNSSFLSYTYLKKLYLNDNMIMTIESGTFATLTNLDSLDLTMNALVELPASILHLPSLRRLILSKNIRLDILTLFNKAGVVTAPIQYLDISYNPSLTQLPHFGTMMDLVHLNVTGNHVTNVSKTHFLGLCNFRWFTSENTTIEFNSACDCAQIDRWFEYKKVTTNPLFLPRCEFAQDKCMEDIEPRKDEIEADGRCIQDYEVRETMRNISQICLIVFGIIGGIILVVGICYVYYRLQRFTDDENKNVKNEKDLKNDKASVNLLKLNNDHVS